MKKLLIALAGAACLLSSVSAAQADQLQDIEKRGVIRIAVPQDFPPFGSVGTDLQPQGYDIDMARYLAKSMKLKLQLVPVTSANRVPYLQTDKVDLVISSLGKNAEREKVIDFSRAYAPFFLGVFGPKGAELKDAAALSGKSIGVTRGAVEDMVLTSVAPQAAQIKRYEDNNTTLSAYLSGQVQYVATGNLVVAAISRQNADKAPVPSFMLKDSPCFIGLKKNEPALKAKVEGYQEGSIKLGGMTITNRDSQAREISRSIGMVFQNFNLFPHMTALENVMLAPRRVLKKSQAECRELAQRMLEKVGLGDRLDYYPANLSGGQQQRVAIARALAMSPKVLLCDEITSALDPELVGEVLKVLEQLAAEGMTLILVTHEMNFAREVGDRVVFMHQGRVWEQGDSKTLFASPQTSELKQFISSVRGLN